MEQELLPKNLEPQKPKVLTTEEWAQRLLKYTKGRKPGLIALSELCSLATVTLDDERKKAHYHRIHEHVKSLLLEIDALEDL